MDRATQGKSVRLGLGLKSMGVNGLLIDASGV